MIPIEINVKLKQDSLSTIEYALKYFSSHERQKLDGSWLNILFSKVKIINGDKLIALWLLGDSWDPKYGDDFSKFITPFVSSGDIKYELSVSEKAIVNYIGKNKAKISIARDNVVQNEHVFEYKWNINDFQIIKMLLLNVIKDKRKINPTINLGFLYIDYGLEKDIIEDILYSLIGRKIYSGNYDSKNMIFLIDSNQDEQNSCPHCYELILPEDKFCSRCGKEI